jgi:hypothetical protein
VFIRFLFQPKADGGFRDNKLKLIFELLLCLIRREIQRVEAVAACGRRSTSHCTFWMVNIFGPPVPLRAAKPSTGTFGIKPGPSCNVCSALSFEGWLRTAQKGYFA